MTMTPIEKVTYHVTREFLASKDKALSSVLDAVAKELAPLVTQRVRGHFAELLFVNDRSHRLVQYEDVMHITAVKLRELAGVSNIGVWPTLRALADDLDSVVQGAPHG